jgi:hypothetical protein
VAMQNTLRPIALLQALPVVGLCAGVVVQVFSVAKKTTIKG